MLDGRLKGGLLHPCVSVGVARYVYCMAATNRNARSTWRKPTRSVGNGACVEVGTDGRGVTVRDTSGPTGPVLRYPARAWRAFLVAAKAGKHAESQ